MFTKNNFQVEILVVWAGVAGSNRCHVGDFMCSNFSPRRVFPPPVIHDEDEGGRRALFFGELCRLLPRAGICESWCFLIAKQGEKEKLACKQAAGVHCQHSGRLFSSHVPVHSCVPRCRWRRNSPTCRRGPWFLSRQRGAQTCNT